MNGAETISLLVAVAGVAAAAVLLWRLTRARHAERVLSREVDRLRAESAQHAQAQQSQRLFIQNVFDSLGEGLVALSGSGRVMFANKRASAMFESTDLIGRSFLEVVRKRSLVAAFDKAKRGQASAERMTIGAAGAERQIELHVTPVSGAGDIAAVALFIDITQLERLQRIRRDFLEDFSHEVRTPLAGLRSAVETLEGGSLTAFQEEQLRKVVARQVSRIERLVKDVSELNRIESGELVLERREVDLSVVLRDLCEEFRQRVAGQPVRFTLRAQSTSVHVDPSRTQQIFSNLLDNAWKHGGAQGEVLVEVAAENGQAIVRISDEGDGIPPDEIEKVFHRFYRVDKSRSQDVPGVGLGLAITKHLVLLHGGTIRAYNRAEGGATFEVRLPRG